MAHLSLVCLVSVIIAHLWTTSNSQTTSSGPLCVSPVPANVDLCKIVGKFYFIDIWVNIPNSNTNCVSVNYLRKRRGQPRLQNYTYLDSNGELRTDQYLLTEVGPGQYTRQNVTNPAQTVPVTILYYDGVDLFVYGCLEDQTINRYVLMSRNQNLTQAQKDAIYNASDPIAPGFTVSGATYNGCDINDL